MNVWCRMKRTWLGLSIVGGLVLVLAAPTWADYQAGVDAYHAGDYQTALKEFRPLADQGDAAAQNNLGYMYELGKGVSQDYQEALRWYRLAAEQGDPPAQRNLSYMYYHGQGVPQDYVQAYMWVTLAAAQGYAKAIEGEEILTKKMTHAQLAEAQRLAREWAAKGK